MKPKLTSQQKQEIQMYIKNQLDISPLIDNYSIAGEDLSNAIIKTFNRPDEDISGVILANAIIGEENKITNMNRTIARNCNFRSSRWLGEVWARRIDARNTTFTNVFMPNMDYRYADLRGCDFCGAVFQIATPKAMGSRFSEDFFKDMAKFWNVEIKIRQT